jgi:hypothetical protein
MRTALFWVITQRVLVIPDRCSGTTHCPIFKAPEFKKKAGFTGRRLYRDERSSYRDESSLYRDESNCHLLRGGSLQSRVGQ